MTGASVTSLVARETVLVSPGEVAPEQTSAFSWRAEFDAGKSP